MPAQFASTNENQHDIIIIAQQPAKTEAMAGNAAGAATMTSDAESTDPLLMMAAASGVATLVLASGLAYVMTRRSKE